MSQLVDRRCQSCDKNTPKLTSQEQELLRRQIPDWELREERLHRQLHFRDFPASIRFVDEMARIAETEGHHPVFTVNIANVDVEIWTHAVGGLSENDFILAAKLEQAAARV